MDYRFNLLKLPLELRQMIYRAYLHADSGYICDAEALFTGKLRGEAKCRITQADGNPVDIALVFTCRAVAREMLRGGLALRVNTVAFSTFYSDEFRQRGERLNAFRSIYVDCNIFRMMRNVGSCLRGPVYDALKNAFPVFMPVVEHFRDGNPDVDVVASPDSNYGQAPSLYRGFVKLALQLACRYYDEQFDDAMYQDFADREWHGCNYVPDYRGLAACSIEPWIIPTDDDIEQIMSYNGWPVPSPDDEDFEIHLPRLNDRSKYRFSAAASAIYFLDSFPDHHRAHLRNIVLNEDREAVSQPACHVQGLIPFCKENPLLRIERRCSLWGNVFRPDWQSGDPESRIDPEIAPDPKLRSSQVSRNVATWIMEALALEHHGMPPGAFSLLLDGGPAPQLCGEIFKTVVQRDVAWQLARDEARRRGYLPARTWIERNGENPWLKYYSYPPAESDLGYRYEGFPQAMRDVAEQKSVVSCNFDVGVPWDVERIVEERRDRSEQEWNEDWFEHKPLFWQTVPPLPLWADCLREDVLPPDGNTSAGRGGFDEWLARWDASLWDASLDSEDE